MKRVVFVLTLTLLLASVLTLAFDVQPTKAATSSIYIIDPGPDSYPAKWDSSDPDVGCVGTPCFNFTEGSYGTFFINVTIRYVNCMKAWDIGIIYDNTTLDFVSAWLPSDHVFAPITQAGIPDNNISVVVADYDTTHKEVQWGFSYIMPDPPWTFNGTGTLCQIQFKMIKLPNFLNRLVTAVWSFDPAWTGIHFYPTGDETPTLNSAYLKLTWLVNIWPEFYTKPAEYKAYENGEDVAVEVWVRNIDPGWEIIAFQFSLWYNTSMLELTSVENGTWLDGFVSNNESTLYAVLEKFGPSDINWLGGGAFMLPGAENTFWPPYPDNGGMLFRFHFKAVSETIFPAEDWTWLEINETVTTNIFGMEVTTGPSTGCHYRAPVKGLGDINNDGKVDMGDVVISLDAFGSFPASPRWNPVADIDGNGRVDIADIVIILTNFGQHHA